MIKEPKELPEHVGPKADKIDMSTVETIHAKQSRLRKEQDEACLSMIIYFSFIIKKEQFFWWGKAAENWTLDTQSFIELQRKHINYW